MNFHVTLNLPIVIATVIWLVLMVVWGRFIGFGKSSGGNSPFPGIGEAIGCGFAMAGWGVITVLYCVFWIIYLLVTK